MLTFALTHHWTLRQIDVNNIFIHGELIEEVFKTQPPSFQQQYSNVSALVCHLHKALFGLKQALRACFE